MGHSRGFSYVELLVVGSVMTVAAGAAVPAMNNAFTRNKVLTGVELVAAQVREARLAAITRNRSFRVAFDCPVAGAIRMLVVTGNPVIDDAGNRCTTVQPNDGPPVYLPQDLAFGGGTPPVLHVNGRGGISAIGGVMPQTISVRYGYFSQAVRVTATGRVVTRVQMEQVEAQ